MNVNEFLTLCTQTETRLKLLSGKYQSLTDNVTTIIEGCRRLMPLAKACTYKGINANGYFAYMKIVFRYLDLVGQNLNLISKKYEDLLLISKFLMAYLDSLTMIEEKLKDYNMEEMDVFCGILPLIDPSFQDESLSLGIKILRSFWPSEDYRKGIEVIFSKYPGFWLASGLNKLYHISHFVITFFSTGPSRSLKMLTDEKFYRKTLADRLYNATDQFPVFWAKLFTAHLPSIFNDYVFSSRTAKSKNVYVPRLNPFVIQGNTIEKCFNERSESDVRCRLIYTTSKDRENRDTLVLHMHGGGYLIGSPDADESTFLRDWCNEIPGCTILSVNYALGKMFPFALQDVFDVYVWLTASDESRKQLGFEPKRIILCGDSAGGGLALGLLLVLYDLNNRYEVKVQLPASLVSFYGFFTLSMGASASRLTALLDTLTFMSISILCHAQLAGFAEGPQGESGTSKSMFKSLMDLLTSLVPCIGFQKPWYLESDEDYESLHRMCSKHLSTRYASPLFLKEVRQIEIPLFLITTEFCPLLDDTIALAKIWKGPVFLDVVTDLPHSFIHLTSFSPKAKHASNLCCQRLSEAVKGSNLEQGRANVS